MNPIRRQLLQGLLVLAPAAILMPRSLWAEETTESLQTVPVVVHSDQGPHRLMVEAARTLAQRGKGLMEREHLEADAGMLFLYRETQTARNGFWMYRTRIPLDIAFLGEDGRIVTIATMQPCESSSPGDCPVTRPEGPYAAALEVNAGYFEERGIKEGDCVSWPGSCDLCVVDDPA